MVPLDLSVRRPQRSGQGFWDLCLRNREGGRGIVSGHLAFSSGTGVSKGQLSLTGSDVAARHDQLALAGDLELVTHVSSSSPTLRTLDLTGTTLALRDVDLAGRRLRARERRDGWWADVRVTGGAIAPAEPVYLRASVDTTMRDTGPLIAFLAQKKKLPGPVQDALTLSAELEDSEIVRKLEQGR